MLGSRGSTRVCVLDSLVLYTIAISASIQWSDSLVYDLHGGSRWLVLV